MAPITVEELLARARARLQRVGPAEAAEACGARLVDTRSEDDRRREGVIPGSLHIRLSVLPWRAGLLFDGGFRAWAAAGLPVD